MEYSILLPYYDPNYEKTEKFSKLIRSIVRNASTDDYEFVIVKDGPSYVQSHNRALQNAKGKRFIIFNDDIEVLDPEFIEKMTSDTSIMGWRATAHAWGISRKNFERIGYFDERFKDGFNCEDSDYFHRAKLKNILVLDANVEMKHRNNSKPYGDRDLNRKLFIEKWGFDP